MLSFAEDDRQAYLQELSEQVLGPDPNQGSSSSLDPSFLGKRSQTGDAGAQCITMVLEQRPDPNL